jgi:hypothetical protein
MNLKSFLVARFLGAVFAILLVQTVASCKKAVDLQGFDANSWKQDTNACQNKRIALYEDFEKKIKPQLKGLSETELIALLGRADKQELFKRSQKFYYYYIEAGKHCANSGLVTQARMLQIRLDAINKVSEIVVVYN